MARFNLDDLLTRTRASGDCLIWQKAKSKSGYGQVWDGQKVAYVHRLVAEIVHGKPSAGQEVLHSCDVRACCNPVHLRWGSRKENMQDAAKRKRLVGRNHTQGESHPHSKLTWLEVQDVRAMRQTGITLKELALKYQVSIAAIHNIVKGKVRQNG
jgi:hypothetical protein